MGQGGAGEPGPFGVLTMLYVLPEDPVFGIIFKSHKAALLRTADLGAEREGQREKVAGDKPLGHGGPLPSTPCAPESRARLEGGGQWFQRQSVPGAWGRTVPPRGPGLGGNAEDGAGQVVTCGPLQPDFVLFSGLVELFSKALAA